MEGHLNLPKRIQEPSGSLNNTFSDGEITYTIEAPKEWWRMLSCDSNSFRINSPRAAMYDTFPTKLDI
jgi:hypothetical protein